MIFQKLLIIGAVLFLLPKSVLAAEDAIASIEIEVELFEDGSAIITEVWDIINAYDGTEYYIVMDLPENMAVQKLQVWDQSETPFAILVDWEVDASLEEKAYKAGILETATGYELCWGMSRYGDHTFTVQYLLTNLVKEYSDFTGLYHQFVSNGLSSAPESVSVTIWMSETELTNAFSNLEIEGFNGAIAFTDEGAVRIQSNGALKNQDYVNVKAQIDQSLFHDLVVDADELLEMRNSQLGEDVLALIMIGVASAIGVLGFIFYRLSLRLTLSDGTVVKKPRWKDVEPTHALPCNGSLAAAYYAFSQIVLFVPSATAFRSYLMKWKAEKIITIEEVADEEIEMTFKEKVKPRSEIELTLYDMLYELAGTDQVLTTEQIKDWEEGPSAIAAWENELREVGKNEGLRLGYLATDSKGKVRFTHQGYVQLIKLRGFMKYVHEFEFFHKQNENQVTWQNDYLIFATLLGMSDTVSKYFELHPDEFKPDLMNMYTIMLLTHHLNHSNSDTSASMASSGGGFSGGGGGGGSR